MLLNNFFFFLSHSTHTHTLSLSLSHMERKVMLCHRSNWVPKGWNIKFRKISREEWSRKEKSRNARVSIVELSCEEISSILRRDAFLKYNTFVGRIKSRRRSKKNHRLKSGLGRKPKRVEVTLASRFPDRKHTSNNTWTMSRSRG